MPLPGAPIERPAGGIAPVRSHMRYAFHVARSWHQDHSFRARLLNIGHLLSGNLVTGIVSLVAVAFTARAVGAHNYGILALTITYARAVERLVTFQSWQPLIKYGAALNDTEHRDDFRSLLKFGLALDLAGAVAAVTIAIGLAVLARPLFGWDAETVHLVSLYCVVLLFNLNGTPTAILRLFGRFQAAAYGPVIGAALRVILCGIGLWMKFSLGYFIMVWMGTQILGSLTFLGFGLRILRQHGIRGVHRASLRGVTRRFPGIWNFAWLSNLSLTIRSSAQQIDTLLVGALADPLSAGLYHIAKQVGRMAQQIGIHVQAVLYPDVARLWAKGAFVEFRRAIIQVEVMLAIFGIGIFLFLLPTAEPILRFLAGPEFAAAAPLLTVQAGAVTLVLVGSPARSALLAMGKQRQVLNVVLAGTAAFHVTALLLIPRLGAMGANVAHVFLGAIWCIGLGILLKRALGEHKPGAMVEG